MSSRLLKSLAALLIFAFLLSQNVYAFGSTALTTNTPILTPLQNPNLPGFTSQNQNPTNSKNTNIIGLSLAAIQGQFIDKTVSTLSAAFSKIKVQLFSSLGQYGVEKLATSMGLDPQVSTLIGTPVSVVLHENFTKGFQKGTDVINAVNTGILRGATSVGIQYATQKADLDPLLGSLTSRAISGAISGAISKGHDIFGGIFNAFKQSALNVARLGISGTDPWSQAQFLQRAVNFSDIIRQKGFAQALEDSAAQIFHEDAVSSILQSFKTVKEYIQYAIDNNKFNRVEINGKFFRELEVKPGHSIRATDDLSDLARIQKGKDVMDSTYGGSFGKVEDVFGAIATEHKATIGDAFNSYELFERIENGQQAYAEIKDSQGNVVLVIEPDSGGHYNLYNSYGDYVDAKISDYFSDGIYAMSNNTLFNIEGKTVLSSILGEFQIETLSTKLGIPASELNSKQVIVSVDSKKGISTSISLDINGVVTNHVFSDVFGDLNLLFAGVDPATNTSVSRDSLEFRRILVVTEWVSTKMIAGYYENGLFEMAADLAKKLTTSEAIKGAINYAKTKLINHLQEKVDLMNEDTDVARNEFFKGLGEFLNLFKEDIIRNVLDRNIAEEALDGYEKSLSHVIEGFQESDRYQQSLKNMKPFQKYVYDILMAYHHMTKDSD